MKGSREISLRRSTQAAALTLFLSLGIPPHTRAQQETSPSPLPHNHTAVYISLERAESTVQLPHQFIAQNTDTLVLDSSRVLVRGKEYSLDYRWGSLRLDSLLISRLRAESPQGRLLLQIRYRFFPFRFKDSYALRRMTTILDSSGRGDSVAVTRTTTSLTMDNIFGPGLQKSGSIVRGFTVGSNRDLSLNSGLRMQLAGRITSDIEIAASLTDENTPIQPEGVTQTLQEFDKVFVEIRSPDASATLGDFVLELPGTEFARLTRKLQGAKGSAAYSFSPVQGSVTVAGALTRGKYTIKEFTGSDGVQGPFILTGQNNERAIIVIAGTERVYVDGELQTRGELNDYVIDYSIGEVMFTARRLITSRSRITLEYEYTDRRFSRSLLAAQTTNAFFDNKAKLTLTFFREADDPDSPIDYTLSDSARAILAGAGGDRDKAVVSGVTEVDSNGTYVRIDTLLEGGTTTVFYRYAPGDPAARYNIVFSTVGPGKGEYVRERAGVFVWKGIGGGDYLPIVYLPMPELHRVLDVGLDLQPVTDLHIAGELAQSLFSANRFSTIPGTERSGHALSLSAAYAPRDVKIGDVNLGSFDLRLKERYMGADFVPVDRANDVEFGRKWGLDSLAQSDEEIQEASLQYRPVASLQARAGFGKFRRGSEQQSTRYEAGLVLDAPDLPIVRYGLEDIQSSETSANAESDWLRHRGNIEHVFGLVTTGIGYEGERRNLLTLSTGTVGPGSYQFDVVTSSVRLKQWGKLSASAQFSWEWNKKFLLDAVIPEARSFTQAYALRLSEWNSLSSGLDVTFRYKSYTEQFRQSGNDDVRSVLVRSQNRYSPLNRGIETDLVYQVATELSSRVERVFVRVAPGSGSYKYLGDLNNNGLADDDEFVQTRFDGDFIAQTLPTDRLFPTIELKTSMRFRITPRRFMSPASGFWGDALNLLSAESYIRIEEKSTEEDLQKIYLLHLSSFQSDSTTIAGSFLFSQDVYVMEGNPLLSARLRFSEQRGMGNYSEGIERTYVRERSVRLRWQLIPELANQFDFINRLDRATGELPPTRQHDISSNSLTLDFSYRPVQNIELGWKIGVSRSEDRLLTPALSADLNSQAIRFVTAFQGAGQARVEFAREEVLLSGDAEWFPYELTGGRVPGKTWLWRLEFEYRLTQFLQATAGYEGRSEGGAAPVHTARMDVRAFF